MGQTDPPVPPGSRAGEVTGRLLVFAPHGEIPQRREPAFKESGPAARFRQAAVLHLHGGGFETFWSSQPRLIQKLIRTTLRKVDTITVLGVVLKEYFRLVGDDVHDKVVAVPNGLPLGVDEPETSDLSPCDRRQLGAAHVFVLPTYYPWEGQPLSIIEAMAFGIPVVSTKYKGIPDQVVEGVTGLFVEPKNPQSVTKALISITSDRDTYESMSEASRSRYQQHFTRKAHLARLSSVVLKRE